MNRTIRKVAVLGSGIMGSRIACHFANIGVEVLLLDIAPRELNEEEKKKGLTLDSPVVKNRIVQSSFDSTLKSNPAPLYHKRFASRIRLGNFADDMAKIKDYDWTIEVVVENLEIKKKIYDEVEKHRKPGTLITSNTSGIPIHLMAEGRSEDFQKYFCGTHFFNPPRYLKLLEIIPTPKTDPEIVKFLMRYGDLYLGKTTVLCKDTPAFIANRVGIYGIMKAVDSMRKLDLNIDEIDKLTGPVIGRPKSATFRTSDVVGLDTLIKVANNLYAGLPHDEGRDMFKMPDEIKKLETNKWLGDKTGQGFYKKAKNSKGESEILTLDLSNFEAATFSVAAPPKDEEFESRGSDTLDLSAFFGVQVNLGLFGSEIDPELNRQQIVTAGGFWLTIFGLFENVIGTAGDDLIIGNNADNRLVGGGGNDFIQSLGGDDTLEGSTGDDTLEGGTGNDTYIFSGTLLGTDMLLEAANADQDRLDFFGLGSGITLDLALSGSQVVNSDSNLILGSVTGFEDSDSYNHCCINNMCGGSVERYFRGRKYFWTEPYAGCETIVFHYVADGCC